MIELAHEHGIHPVAVAALWFVARYAAGVEPAIEGRWLALAERIRADSETARALEEVPQGDYDGPRDHRPRRAARDRPSFDPTAALNDAAAWVASRSPTEVAPRDGPSNQSRVSSSTW